GKVDRKALPAPELALADGGTEYVAPRTQLEEIICAIWEKVLNVNRIGIYDDFFNLGGDSLLIVKIINRIRETFKLELPFRSIFESRTVHAFARVIIQNQNEQKDSNGSHMPAITKDESNNAEYLLDRLPGLLEQELDSLLESLLAENQGL